LNEDEGNAAMRILLVDDEDITLETVGDFLEDCDHEVVRARNGAEALKRLEEHHDTGLVISDIRMPEMDGTQLLQVLRLRLPGVPVILITGHGDEDTAVEAFHYGVYDYMRKPIKLEELMACIERVEREAALESDLLGGITPLELPGETVCPDPTEPGAAGQEAKAESGPSHCEGLWHRVQNCMEQLEDPLARRRVQSMLLSISQVLEEAMGDLTQTDLSTGETSPELGGTGARTAGQRRLLAEMAAALADLNEQVKGAAAAMRQDAADAQVRQ